MELHVQFADSTETVIIASFGCQQDTAFYPNQGVVESDDPRYVAFLETLPSPLA